MSGCRAPELAGGFADSILNSLFDVASGDVIGLTNDLDSGARSTLMIDWDIAKAQTMLFIQAKLSHWGHLPYVLCVLGMPYEHGDLVRAKLVDA
eukprot:15484203-Alexandrium_andersonii.AAC.1